ncbi:S-layer homology domain-containing protein [Effusibacillus consociatus]|uniref:S-layer homology domain-containing protein n=1 Tax=Effusibacillus consociatus TaxID=1117041 RepID=A0ABV9Q4F2_9BACL
MGARLQRCLILAVIVNLFTVFPVSALSGTDPATTLLDQTLGSSTGSTGADLTQTADSILSGGGLNSGTISQPLTPLPGSNQLPSELPNEVPNQLPDQPIDNLIPGSQTGTEVNISVSKISGADSAVPGGLITYRILVRNNKDTAIESVQLLDKLPQQVAFVSAPGASYSSVSNTVIWNIGELAAKGGSIQELHVKVNESAPAGTLIENRATVKIGDREITSPPNKVIIGPAEHMAFIDGYQDQTFRPENWTTRAEMATIVARIKGLKTYQKERSFQDLDRTHWAYSYIQAAAEAGIFSGYPDGKFYPDRPISRAELTMVVLRMNGLNPPHFSTDDSHIAKVFKDVGPSHWARDAIQTAAQLSFVSGYADGSFRPDNEVKRVEAVVMMNRSLGRGPLVDGDEKVEQHFTDVPRTFWGFGWIEEAAKKGHLGVHSTDGERLVRYTN